jgi:hypothetical protein
MLDAINERLMIRRELMEAKIAGEMYDPNEPVDIEAFGKVFAEEFYRAFPDAKEKIAEQMQEYRLKKHQEEARND